MARLGAGRAVKGGAYTGVAVVKDGRGHYEARATGIVTHDLGVLVDVLVDMARGDEVCWSIYSGGADRSTWFHGVVFPPKGRGTCRVIHYSLVEYMSGVSVRFVAHRELAAFMSAVETARLEVCSE